MGYMEISTQGISSLKIKGKGATIFVNPQDKTENYDVAILLGNHEKSSRTIRDDVVVITGPGEYEVRGIKITGMSANGMTVFTITMDNLDILLGDLAALEKVHQKLKEHNVAIIYAGSVGNSSFASALALNATLFMGEKAREVVDIFAKNEKKETAKYTISAEKLPSETETVLLT